MRYTPVFFMKMRCSKMGAFFDTHLGSGQYAAGDTGTVIRAIADHYIGQNPQYGFRLRAFLKDTFLVDDKYRTVFDLNERFPQALNGSFVYAWAMLWSDKEQSAPFAAAAQGPMRVYLNGNECWRASLEQEKYSDRVNAFSLPLQAGWNHFVVRFEKTMAGFGGRFGTGFFKNFPFCFFCPTQERRGQVGWLYTEPVMQEWQEIPSAILAEAQSDRKWLPAQTAGTALPDEMFAYAPGKWAVSQTAVLAEEPTCLHLEMDAKGRTEVLLDGEMWWAEGGNTLQVEKEITAGRHMLMIRRQCMEDGWGTAPRVSVQGAAIRLSLPAEVAGAHGVWVSRVPLDQEQADAWCDAWSLPLEQVMREQVGPAPWILDEPAAVVRPYLECNLYGKWNYPLGVTLFGLLEAGRLLGQPKYVEYVHDHVEQCTAWYEYSLQDGRTYGAAGINNQIAAVDSLDDCGSFAATMLSAEKDCPVRGCDRVADDVAEYIMKKQSRLEDGTLYRQESPIDLMPYTMWIDDLYMSVPFLCRYAIQYHKPEALEDAVHQFLNYKKYLYMPDKKIMAHVYDVMRQCNTAVPWGRGNGWVLFSLSELLATMDEKHPKRGELEDFFRDLCEGIGGLQDREGFWHQVLTDRESYPESSCTAMFVCAFARGIRMGLLPRSMAAAVRKGWQALSEQSVDYLGNVYGVCRGSGYSFSERYYKYDLPWVLNDPHGIGIVMLAGVETCKLKQWESAQV